jgi:hypothetical protein
MFMWMLNISLLSSVMIIYLPMLENTNPVLRGDGHVARMREKIMSTEF